MTISLSTLKVITDGDSTGYQRSMDGKVAADTRAIASDNQLRAGMDQTDRRLTTSASGWDRFVRTLQGVTPEQFKIEAGTRRLNGALDAGKISADEHGRLVGLLQQRYAVLTPALNGAAEAHTRLSTQGMEAFHVMRSFGEQLAIGTPITQAFTQHISQLTYAASGAGGLTGAFGEAISTLRGFITPITAAIAGVAALAAGAGFLILRASETEARLRSFDTILNGMGASSNVTARGLDIVVKGLRDTGTAADQALAAVQAFARVPGINPASATQLVPLARDIGAVTGQDLSSVATKMAAAFAESTAAAVKLTFALGGPNALTESEVKNMTAMAAHGDRAGALKVAIDALQRQMGGSFQSSLSDSTKAINSISAAWANMLDKLSSTTAVQTARDAVVGMMNAISRAASTPNPVTPEQNANAARQALGLPALTPAQAQQIQIQGQGQNNVAGGALTTQVTIGVDPRVLEVFEITKTITGEGAVVTPHGGTTGNHVAGSQHYPQNTTSGMGLALDYTLPDGQGGQLPYNYAPYGSDVYARYKNFNDTFAAQMQQRYGVYGTSGLNFNDPGHVDARGLPPGAAYGTGVFANVGQTPSAGAVPNSVSQEDLTRLGQLQSHLSDIDKATAKLGDDKIWWTSYFQALGPGEKDITAIWTAMSQANSAVAQHRTELEKAATTQALSNDLALKGAEAFGKDEVSGLQAAAMAQATLAARQGDAISVQAKYTEILRTGAVEAIGASAKALPGLVQQTAATERLAEAAKQGAGAEHAAEVQNQVTTATHDALTKAVASGDPALIARAKALRDLTEAQIKANDAALQAKAIQDSINTRTDQIAVLGLQTGMQGQTPEAIATATSLLQEQQKLIAQGVDLSSDKAKNDLASVAALGQANIAYAEAVRNQQRLDDGIRSVAQTIDSTLTKSIEDAFSGAKVESWGTRIKSMLASLAAQITDALFIKPLLGSIIGGLGFGSAAQSFGSFGSLFGGSSSGSATLTPNSNGTFSISNVGSAASVLNNGSSLFGGGDGLFGSTFSGIKGFFNDIGTSLGFAPSGLAAGTGSGAGIFTNLTTGATSDVLGSGVAQGLFGSTTLGGLFGGIGAGFGAGTLLNSLLGGNKLGGTLGSGAGSIAGSLIGSLLFPGIGTLLGGLLGGAGGGLFGGMFGNSKPSNASAGGGINLATGKVDTFQGGNQSIDQPTLQAIQQLSQGLAVLKTIPGNTLGGQVLFQNGVNTGTTVDWSGLTGVTGVADAGRMSLGKDPAQAALTIFETLARGLTGVSDTVQKIIAGTTDLTKLAENLQFGVIYDNIAKAAETSFASVEDATKRAGPFQQAFDAISATFDDLTAKATEFGLSLDPINAALAEATKRLQGDFTDSLNKAFNEASGKGFLNQAQTVWDNYIANITESQAIGLGADRATQDKLGQVATAQLNQIFSGLSVDQLQQVVTQFTGLNDTIVGLATSAETAAAANTDLANSQEAVTRTTAATGRITDYLTSLKSTPSAVTSPQDALSFASTNYQALLGRARGGDLTSLEGLTDAAGSLVSNLSSFYGATQPGAQQVSQIEQDLATVVATYGGGSNPTISAITGSTSAIQVAAASNDNWLSSIFDVTSAFGDRTGTQLDKLISIMTEVRDNLRLQAAG